MRKVWAWLLVVSFLGFVASMVIPDFIGFYKAYGEVPIPGSGRLHLPAGDVVVSFHAEMPGANQGEYTDLLPIPQNLELAITAPNGAAQPSVTDQLGSATAVNTDAHRPVKVAHMPVAGDYTITTNGTVSPFRLQNGKPGQIVSPRLSFGHDNPFGFLPWLFGGLCVVSLVGLGMLYRETIADVLRGVRSVWFSPRRTDRSDAGSKPVISAAELLASGQRVRGVLKSFRATGETVRSLRITPSRPEFLDYPYYALEVELLMPSLASVVGRNRQPVPLTEVPNLAIGMELNCAVDPADPASRFKIDWS